MDRVGGLPPPPEKVVLSKEALASVLGDRWPVLDLEAAADLLALRGGQFPSGARKLPRELVEAVQRERLILAMLRATTELGYRAATVQHVIERAGVSRPTFYEHFENKEVCFLAALDRAAARLRACVSMAVGDGDGEGDWRDRLHAGIEATLRFLSAEPDIAFNLIVEARTASLEALLRHDELLAGFSTGIDLLAAEDSAQPAHVSTAVVGGLETVLCSHLAAPPGPGLEAGSNDLEYLLPTMMQFVAFFYGAGKAS